MSEVSVIAIITPTAERKSGALEGFAKLAAEVEKSEPECLVFRIHENDDGEFIIFQQYKNMAAFEAHQKAEYSQKAFAASKDGLAKEPYVKVFTSKATAGFGPR